MTDDLVKRLWIKDMEPGSLHREASDRIEALTAERDALREALTFYANGDWYEDYPGGVRDDVGDVTYLDYGQKARDALAQTGEDTPEAKKAPPE